MKRIKQVIFAAMFAVSAIASPMLAMADEELPKVMGEVKKVKPKSGKITIKHEPIPNLDMPGMSMVFRIAEDVDITQYKKGDAVEFTVVERDGKMVIVSIEKSE